MYRGAKWISLRRDFQSAFYYWRQGDLTPRQWFQSWRGKKAYAFFAWTDPLPFFYDLAKLGVVFKSLVLDKVTSRSDQMRVDRRTEGR